MSDTLCLICPVCRKTSFPTDEECWNCGTDLTRQTPRNPEAEGLRTCPFCRGMVEPERDHCPYCDGWLSRICLHCGKDAPLTGKTCPHCRNELDKRSEPVRPRGWLPALTAAFSSVL